MHNEARFTGRVGGQAPRDAAWRGGSRPNAFMALPVSRVGVKVLS